MITIFEDVCNPISQDFYDKTINSIQLHQLTCTCGHSACLTIHAYYKRRLKFEDGSIKLKICRVKCSNCQKTHALLPSFIVPYSQISFQDQLEIISCYEDSRNYKDIMDNTPSIDENCVRSIVRRYVHHWLERILSIHSSASHSLDFIQLCFETFGRQFMQIKRTPNILFLAPT